MVGVFPEPLFASREFPQMPPGRLCPSLLQTLTQGMEALPRLLNGLSTERFTRTVSSQVDDAKIDTECVCHFIGRRRRNFQRHSQVERSVAIDEISLSLDRIHTRLLIGTETEWDKHTARDRQEGHDINALEVHHPLIVDNRTLRPECRFDALIPLIDIGCFADSPNSQLCRQMIGSTQFTIGHLLQLKLVGNLGFKCLFSNVVTSSVKSMHGVKQRLSLFSCRSEFQEHRLFHGLSIARLRDTVKQWKVFLWLSQQAISPPLECRRIPCLFFVKGSARTMVMQDSVSTAFHTGIGQTNLIAIVATGPNFSLYINHQYVNKGSDSANTLSSGLVGVSADSNSNPTEVAYSDARVWML